MLQGHCTCNAITFTTSIPTTKTFICHCIMCPTRDRIYHNGAPWIAITRPTFYQGKLRVVRSSTFATRTRCFTCDDAIYLRYDCEPHTDWIHASTLAHSDENPEFDFTTQPSLEHVHADTNASVNSNDGHTSSDNFGSWTPDICRPSDIPEPNVCLTCFQLLPGHCTCTSPSTRVTDNFREVGADVLPSLRCEFLLYFSYIYSSIIYLL